MEKRFDTIVIGAGMSGLGAGIRLAHFGQKVGVLEKHALWGGLNSFYKRAGRPFDVGLHAMTNFAPRGKRGPLSMICRQLRLNPDELNLKEQLGSEVRFPSAALKFSNECGLLESEIEKAFPKELDGFRKLRAAVEAYDDGSLAPNLTSSRERLAGWIRSPLLIDLLLCPLLFYGSATEHDMNWHQFVIMFKAIYLEGFCRPEGGVRHLLSVLKREYLNRGGELYLKTGVRKLIPRGRGGVYVELENGDVWEADRVLSSAGKVETARLLGEEPVEGDVGPMTFVETIFCLDRPAADLGWEQSILFFSTTDKLEYRRPEALVDTTSGIVCCPENFRDQRPFAEGSVRVTSIANFEAWKTLRYFGEEPYEAGKRLFVSEQLKTLATLGPTFRANIKFQDSFTPLTIQRFTSHAGGAVYGATEKTFSGDSGARDVHLCGTDQGYLGIVGALLSGVIMANRHALVPAER